VALLVVFVFIELRVDDPMFKLTLFKIPVFTWGNVAAFLSALTRGGLQFMVVIWLQGIWLPLHGYSFADTPLWAGIYMAPMLIGFIIAGPIAGALSDRFGARWFMVGGNLINAFAFIGLTLLPANFDYPIFGSLLILLGIGQGLFAAPNTATVMNSVPRDQRGVGSGMRATFQNAASLLSMGVFFSIVTAGLAAALPPALTTGLSAAGLPGVLVSKIANLPPTAALFAAFLGYNPMGTLLPPAALHALPQASQAALLSKEFFPRLIATPFMDGLTAVFWLSAILSVVAALASLVKRQTLRASADILAEGAIASDLPDPAASVLEEDEAPAR
jgi:MFS family permease